MNMTQQIQQVELTIEEAKKHINRMNALIKLSNNKEYKEIFLEGFFKDYAIQQVMLKGDPSQQGPDDQAAIIRNIDSIAAVRFHLHAIMAQGRQMEGALVDHEETLGELREEDMNDV